MKVLPIALGLLLLGAEAHAISRHDTARLTCQQVHTVIDREGEAILRYPSARNPGLQLYDRYVRSRALCRYRERAVSVQVPVAGSQACPVTRCEPIRRSARN